MENKEEQKKLLIEIMEADGKDGLYEQQTAVEWFWIHLPENISKEYFDLFEQAKKMEQHQIVMAYEWGWVNGDLKKAPRFGKDHYSKEYNNTSNE